MLDIPCGTGTGNVLSGPMTGCRAGLRSQLQHHSRWSQVDWRQRYWSRAGTGGIPAAPKLAASARKAADLGSAGFTCRPRTTTATRRAPASLSATATDCALPPETQVSSITRTSAPVTESPTRTQPGLTPRVWISWGAIVNRTNGSATHGRTRSTSGCAPRRPCPLGTTATAVGPAVILAAAHTECPWSARNAASNSRSRAAAAAASAAAARSDLYRRRSSASAPPRTAYPIGTTASARSSPSCHSAISHW